MEQIDKILANLNVANIDEFMKKNNSTIKATTKVHKVISDTSWISMIEDSIPYLDNIIRNPRRFIVQEENIVPIEKTKVVTEESIRHLAQNTNLIQDVDEDGTVIPLKLLNVYREETVDLYENRFIKSLVDNLYGFVNDKLRESNQKSYVDVVNDVSYNVNDEDINVSLKIASKNKEEIITASKDGHTIEERIEYIKDVLAAFRGSQFIKSLAASQPVRSPIRKTNVILKEPNFIKALELWEYLESNAIKPITEETNEEIDRSKELKDSYDLAFYIQNEALKLNKETNTTGSLSKKVDFTLYLEDIIKKSLVSEKELKKQINYEIKKVYAKIKKEEEGVKKEFLSIIKDFEKKKNKAILLLK